MFYTIYILYRYIYIERETSSMFHTSECIRILLFVSIVVLGCFRTTSWVNGGVVLSTGEDVDNLIDTYIQENDVMVFAKSYCPHCKTSKSIIEMLQQETSHIPWSEKFLYLDQMDHDGKVIQNALFVKTGQNTVPNIFIGGKFVGGNSDLVASYQSGELLTTIKDIALSRVKSEL